MEVYPGSTGDPKTVPDQAAKLREDFGLERIVDRGRRHSGHHGHRADTSPARLFTLLEAKSSVWNWRRAQ